MCRMNVVFFAGKGPGDGCVHDAVQNPPPPGGSSVFGGSSLIEAKRSTLRGFRAGWTASVCVVVAVCGERCAGCFDAMFFDLLALLSGAVDQLSQVNAMQVLVDVR